MLQQGSQVNYFDSGSTEPVLESVDHITGNVAYLKRCNSDHCHILPFDLHTGKGLGPFIGTNIVPYE